MPSLEDIPEYREMRRALMALRLEVPERIANDLLGHCERAVMAARDQGWQAGVAFGREEALDPEIQAGGPGHDVR